jgi:hypothetical protein
LSLIFSCIKEKVYLKGVGVYYNIVPASYTLGLGLGCLGLYSLFFKHCGVYVSNSVK